ncbi:UvrD-helicase domain-containing protein [Natronoglomus mannanivorans]|uniref:DNA 3'-5' helicase n=1 Tax=Natronoglomus mannanivorans TaxID=2979990 RepID=A0AAP3E4B6_9EURY|nr:UvrD-helicase domain-containing protein [Halobacteria archaeon AArc-xg1-1]
MTDTDPDNDENTDPLRLEGAQQGIRDAYTAHDSGLFILDCVPGAGKSVVSHHLPAEEVLQRYVNGDQTPEQHVAVVSFARDEASAIIPDVCARLREIVENNLVPEAKEISAAELEYLVQRVRRAPYMGTVDSFLRSIFSEIVDDLGFEDTPSIGNKARLRRVHRECYRRVRDDTSHQERLDELENAYPQEGNGDDVATMLSDATEYCRNQQLSPDVFRDELHRTRESVYSEGVSSSFADVVETAGNLIGPDVATDWLYDEVETADQDRVVEADQALYNEWEGRIEDFCEILSIYRIHYREVIREHGVISHTDVAYFVAAYFADGESDFTNEWLTDLDTDHRERVLSRFRSRIGSLLIDEAQDVSLVQHTAISRFVTSDMRVFAAGDAMQGIYGWRHADPTLFETAAEDGQYLGIDWNPHQTESATTTYRCAPDIAATINAVAKPIFSDTARGNAGPLDVEYPTLNAAREPTDGTSVHVASFDSSGLPGTPGWISPDSGQGEAQVLATYLSSGLADGTFTDSAGDPLGITVLFRYSRWMDTYEEVFDAEGLRVRNASDRLFDAPSVKTVLAVCDWLVAPKSSKRTQQLVTESSLGLDVVKQIFEEHDWDLDQVANANLNSHAVSRTVESLQTLRDARDVVGLQPVATFFEDIIEALSLRADPYEVLAETEPDQRVANLDLFIDTVHNWEDGEHYTLSELLDLLEPFRETPRYGPSQANTSGVGYDVEFRTIHNVKGDQDDVVVIADPGFDVWSYDQQTQRFVAYGDVAGLAPPENTTVSCDVSLPPFRGLYESAEPWDREAGLRWGTALWSDTVANDGPSDRIVGPERLRRIAGAERAESWRLLYVALTRASDHLVIPLPKRLYDGPYPRDRWLDTLRTGCNFPDECTSPYMLDTSLVDPNTDDVEIAVNDVDLFAGGRSVPPTSVGDVTTSAPRRSELQPWIPRFISPSTFYPLTEDLGPSVIPHLLGEALHTETDEVSTTLPLTFDRLGPDAVGRCLHDALTELIKQDIPEDELQITDSTVVSIFDGVLRDIEPNVTSTERAGMLAFFDRVLDDFQSSTLYEEIVDPHTSVRTELPVDGVVSIDDIEVEFHGEADVVVTWPDGRRHIADLKIALVEPGDVTQKRYELQTATYAYLFANELPTDNPVRRSIETFGVVNTTTTSTWPPEIVKRRLSRIVR